MFLNKYRNWINLLWIKFPYKKCIIDITHYNFPLIHPRLISEGKQNFKKLVTVTATKPWPLGKMFPNMNKCEMMVEFSSKFGTCGIKIVRVNLSHMTESINWFSLPWRHWGEPFVPLPPMTSLGRTVCATAFRDVTKEHRYLFWSSGNILYILLDAVINLLKE